jgi:transcriptional regulator with XRE-family HTH domain
LQVALQEKLKEGRTKMGWTQQEAAKKLGCSQKTISTIENGDKRPSIDLLGRAAETYGIEFADLLELVVSTPIEAKGLSGEEAALISAIRAKDKRKAAKYFANLLK